VDTGFSNFRRFTCELGLTCTTSGRDVILGTTRLTELFHHILRGNQGNESATNQKAKEVDMAMTPQETLIAD
jgi:hypothetical protein